MSQEQLNKQLEKLIQYCSKNDSEQCRNVLQFCKSSRIVNNMLINRLSDMIGLNKSNNPITRGDANDTNNLNNCLSLFLFVMHWIDNVNQEKFNAFVSNNTTEDFNFKLPVGYFIAKNNNFSQMEISITMHSNVESSTDDKKYFKTTISVSNTNTTVNDISCNDIDMYYDRETFKIYVEDELGEMSEIIISDTTMLDETCIDKIKASAENIKTYVSNVLNSNTKIFLIIDNSPNNFVYAMVDLSGDDNIKLMHYICSQISSNNNLIMDQAYVNTAAETIDKYILTVTEHFIDDLKRNNPVPNPEDDNKPISLDLEIDETVFDPEEGPVNERNNPVQNPEDDNKPISQVLELDETSFDPEEGSDNELNNETMYDPEDLLDDDLENISEPESEAESITIRHINEPTYSLPDPTTLKNFEQNISKIMFNYDKFTKDYNELKTYLTDFDNYMSDHLRFDVVSL